MVRAIALVIFVAAFAGGSARAAVFDCSELGIRAAIATGGGPHTFACAGPQTVVIAARIVIDNDVILDGEGDLTVDGGSAPGVFLVQPAIAAELRNLAVTGGTGGTGLEGGIINQGDLTLSHCRISGNVESGVLNDAALMLTHCTVSQNGASGIYNMMSGTLTLIQSIVSENFFADGGGVFNTGTANITDSTVSGNTAIDGGGISNIGIGATLVLSNSTVSGNEALEELGLGGFGGGVLNVTGSATLTNSTVSGNRARRGGGISADRVTLVNSTVAGNTADRGDAVFPFENTNSIVLTSSNTLIDGDCRGTVFTFSGGGNLESPGDTCGFADPSDQVDVPDPGISPLDENGGPTETHALLPGSDAIDAAVGCPPPDTDQRGVLRPSGAACDIGSFELVTSTPPDCSAAAPDSSELWPPNHEFEDVSIVGVTDPDGDPVAITITAIAQDEPPLGRGDGNTCPDGEGLGTEIASVRAERSGLGDGRVYRIGFTAEDGQGGECNGTVTVCVPHDRGQGSSCVDGGPIFDSTVCEGNLAAAASAACGIGFELAFLLPPLMWLHQRRRRGTP